METKTRKSSELLIHNRRSPSERMIPTATLIRQQTSDGVRALTSNSAQDGQLSINSDSTGRKSMSGGEDVRKIFLNCYHRLKLKCLMCNQDKRIIAGSSNDGMTTFGYRLIVSRSQSSLSYCLELFSPSTGPRKTENKKDLSESQFLSLILGMLADGINYYHISKDSSFESIFFRLMADHCKIVGRSEVTITKRLTSLVPYVSVKISGLDWVAGLSHIGSGRDFLIDFQSGLNRFPVRVLIPLTKDGDSLA